MIRYVIPSELATESVHEVDNNIIIDPSSEFSEYREIYDRKWKFEFVEWREFEGFSEIKKIWTPGETGYDGLILFPKYNKVERPSFIVVLDGQRYTLYEGEEFTLPPHLPVSYLYEFKGYSDGTNLYQPGDKITESKTLTSVIDPAEYTLKFYDGETLILQTTVIPLNTPEIDLPIITKEGYTLFGWTEGDIRDSVSGRLTVTHSANYTAVWIQSQNMSWEGVHDAEPSRELREVL